MLSDHPDICCTAVAGHKNNWGAICVHLGLGGSEMSQTVKMKILFIPPWTTIFKG